MTIGTCHILANALFFWTTSPTLKNLFKAAEYKCPRGLGFKILIEFIKVPTKILGGLSKNGNKYLLNLENRNKC